MNRLKVLTYNIWFDPIDRIERTKALIATIIKQDPDIICLQEVTSNVYDIIKNTLSHFYKYPDSLDHHYGCVILSKYKFSECRTILFKKTCMHRSLLIVRINDIIIATTHFESIFSKKEKNKIKIAQFKECKDILDEYTNYYNVILCADTNLLNHEEEDFFPNRDAKNWQDCWELKGNNNNKYTFDYYTNSNLYKNSVDKYQSRLDRILFMGGNLDLDNFKLIKSTDRSMPPSDHHGVSVDFIYKNSC